MTEFSLSPFVKVLRKRNTLFYTFFFLVHQFQYQVRTWSVNLPALVFHMIKAKLKDNWRRRGGEGGRFRSKMKIGILVTLQAIG